MAHSVPGVIAPAHIHHAALIEALGPGIDAPFHPAGPRAMTRAVAEAHLRHVLT